MPIVEYSLPPPKFLMMTKDSIEIKEPHRVMSAASATVYLTTCRTICAIKGGCWSLVTFVFPSCCTYDSHAWKKYMGEPGCPCSRIGLQGCTDGSQAHVAGSLSMKPFMLVNFSLPPALRFKTQFMFLLMLLPVNAKGYGLKKYFDFAANFELNSLYYTGESGIKVKIFSLSLDTPGRHELLGAYVVNLNSVVKLDKIIIFLFYILCCCCHSSGMQSEKSYEGACVVCKHKWQEGVMGKQCCFGDYRTFLPARSRGRQARVSKGGHVYEYAALETRSPAPFRIVDSARRCLAVVEAFWKCHAADTSHHRW